MRKGFIFSQNRCVNCGACSAACILENSWSVQPRNIYTYNRSADPLFPIINFTMACNHCEEPICLSGCPSGAFYRDPGSGAVIINSEKCLGCNYCKWNCPYDAPKSEPGTRLIEKCNLCYSLVNEGMNPACASACPTGALDFGEISDSPDNSRINWFPDKKLNPSIEIKEEKISSPLRIIPDQLFDNEYTDCENRRIDITNEWSLIAFSFLSVLSVGIMASGYIKGVLPDIRIVLSIIFSAGILSLFHLRKKHLAWKALINIKSSPLSREIAIYIMYTSLSLAALTTENTDIFLISSAIGLLLLIIIDSVYTYADSRSKVWLHSGQTFISGLLIASFLSGMIYPFILIAGIKIISTVYFILNGKRSSNMFSLRFMRLAILLAAGFCLVTGTSYPENVTTFLFLAGELIDRILFYFDFDPINIKSINSTRLNFIQNEKENN